MSCGCLSQVCLVVQPRILVGVDEHSFPFQFFSPHLGPDIILGSCARALWKRKWSCEAILPSSGCLLNSFYHAFPFRPRYQLGHIYLRQFTKSRQSSVLHTLPPRLFLAERPVYISDMSHGESGAHLSPPTRGSLQDFVGLMIKTKLMAGLPSKAKNYGDYTGMVIPPCGPFSENEVELADAARPPWMLEVELNTRLETLS